MDATLSQTRSRFNLQSAGDAVRLGWAELLNRYAWDAFGTHTYRPAQKLPERFSGQPGGRQGRGVESCVGSFRYWLAAVLLNEAVGRGLASVEPRRRSVDGVTQDSFEFETPREPRVRPWQANTRVVGTYGNALRSGRPSAWPVWVVGLERHRSGLLHMHSLIRWPSMLQDVNRAAAWKLWFDLFGLARIEPPKSMTVSEYVAKYVIKGGDIILSRSFDAAPMAVGNAPTSSGRCARSGDSRVGPGSSSASL